MVLVHENTGFCKCTEKNSPFRVTFEQTTKAQDTLGFVRSTPSRDKEKAMPSGKNQLCLLLLFLLCGESSLFVERPTLGPLGTLLLEEVEAND